MKRAIPPLLSTVRGIRRIRSKKFLCPDPIETLKKPTNRPVKWIEDATTYSDIHNLMTDPSSIPYSRKVIAFLGGFSTTICCSIVVGQKSIAICIFYKVVVISIFHAVESVVIFVES